MIDGIILGLMFLSYGIAQIAYRHLLKALEEHPEEFEKAGRPSFWVRKMNPTSKKTFLLDVLGSTPSWIAGKPALEKEIKIYRISMITTLCCPIIWILTSAVFE